MKTPVVIRAWNGNQDKLVAIFPTIPGTNDPNTCLSYEHIGQHGSCHPCYLVNYTAPAKESPVYSALLAELKGIGYDLEICKRITKAHHATRIAELNRL